MDMSIWICLISCSKCEREQHPRHGFVELDLFLNEALAVGDHLSRSQDVANLKSWRSLGELLMEHPAERLSHLVGLPGKHFVSSQVKEVVMLFQLCLFHYVVAGVTHSRAARFDDDHCRCSRLCRSHDNRSEHCVGITGMWVAA